MADGEHPAIKPHRPTAGQLKLLRSLPDNSKAQFGQETLTLPVDVYLSEERYKAEQEKIFNRMPLPAAPSGMLPENGSYARRTIYGKEVVFTRDDQGVARIFLNVCMHRASRLVTDEECHKGKLLSCPFHAWGYALDGRLAAVPREETFAPDFDKSKFKLPELPSRELGGVIWVQMDPEAPDMFHTIPEEMIEDFKALGMPEMHLFGAGVHEVESNWKLVMDTFQEGYHVVRLHAQSLKGRFEDTIPSVNHLGKERLHMRRSSGRIGYVQSSLEPVEDSLDDIRKLVTIHYTLFPSAVLICSQIYVSLLVFMPTSASTTRVINFMLTNGPPVTEKDWDRYTRSFEMTDTLTFPEDFAASAYSQAGMASGAIKEFTLCSLEKYVWEFHRIVSEFLGEKPSAIAAE